MGEVEEEDGISLLALSMIGGVKMVVVVGGEKEKEREVSE